MFETIAAEKSKVLSLLVVLSFTVAGLTAVTFLSEPFVAAQSPDSKFDPNDCFNSNVTIDTCPSHSNAQSQNDTVDCFKKIQETVSKTAELQNYTKSVENFDTSLSSSNVITSINQNIADGSGPVKDMNGVWDLMKNQNMTRHDRQLVLDEVNNLMADAKPGFSQLQQNALSLCIATELNSLGPTLNY